jgi:cell division protein FtsX
MSSRALKYVVMGGWIAAALVFIALTSLRAADVARHQRRPSEVTVFLIDGVTIAQRNAITERLRGLSVVGRVTYVSKQDAFADFRRLYRDQPELWRNVDPRVLPAHLTASVQSNPEGAKQVIAALRGFAGVQEISPNPTTQPDAYRWRSPYGAIRTGWTIGAGAVLVLLTLSALVASRRHNRREHEPIAAV